MKENLSKLDFIILVYSARQRSSFLLKFIVQHLYNEIKITSLPHFHANIQAASLWLNREYQTMLTGEDICMNCIDFVEKYF